MGDKVYCAACLHTLPAHGVAHRCTDCGDPVHASLMCYRFFMRIEEGNYPRYYCAKHGLKEGIEGQLGSCVVKITDAPIEPVAMPAVANTPPPTFPVLTSSLVPSIIIATAAPEMMPHVVTVTPQAPIMARVVQTSVGTSATHGL